MRSVKGVLASFYMLQMLDCACGARTMPKTVDPENSPGEHDEKCPCYTELKCSSCSFSFCPFEDYPVSKVVPLSSNTSGGSAKAWRIIVSKSSNPGYVLKCPRPSDEVRWLHEQNMQKPVKAAQLAHALTVRTPRILITNFQDCPFEFEQGVAGGHLSTDFLALLDSWGSSGRLCSIQEWAEGLTHTVDGTPDLSVPAHIDPELVHTPWYEAGGVAVLDWLLGNSRLFNDVPIDFDRTQAGLNAVQPKLGNLVIEEKSCTVLDLDIDSPSCKWRKWQACLHDFRDMAKGGPPFVIEWVQKVMMPMLVLVKSKEQDLLFDLPDPAKVFGKFQCAHALGGFFNRLGGYHEFISPMLIQVGMVDTLIRTTHLSKHPTKQFLLNGIPGWHAVLDLPELLDGLSNIRSKLWAAVHNQCRALKGDTMPIRTEERPQDDRPERDEVTCEVQCKRKRKKSLFNWRAWEICNERTVVDFEPQYVTVPLRPPLERRYTCKDVFQKLEWLHSEDTCSRACSAGVDDVQLFRIVDAPDPDVE